MSMTWRVRCIKRVRVRVHWYTMSKQSWRACCVVPTRSILQQMLVQVGGLVDIARPCHRHAFSTVVVRVHVGGDVY